MTIPVSTVPAVKAHLFTLLTSSVTKDGTHGLAVVYSKPGPNQPPDIVAIGKANRVLQPLGMVGGGGPGARMEQYTVDVTVSVYRGAGASGQEVTERWYAIVGQVEQAVRGDVTLGGNVSIAWPLSSDEEADWTTDHEGWLCEGTVQIQCTAEL